MTDDNVTQFPGPELKLLSPLFGPHPEYYSIVVDGRLIPRLTGYKVGEDSTGLVLDSRFTVTVPNELAYQVAWILANALAIGAGYPHLGATSKEKPFAPEVAEISSAS